MKVYVIEIKEIADLPAEAEVYTDPVVAQKFYNDTAAAWLAESEFGPEEYEEEEEEDLTWDPATQDEVSFFLDESLNIRAWVKETQ